VPVAVAVPRDPGLANLLSGLTAASLPHTEQLWVQDAEDRFGSADHALEMLLQKYKDPAAAVLAAHFLVRFKPTRAPVQWLENLSRILWSGKPNSVGTLTSQPATIVAITTIVFSMILLIYFLSLSRLGLSRSRRSQFLSMQGRPTATKPWIRMVASL
jgi:hypothetical protein